MKKFVYLFLIVLVSLTTISCNTIASFYEDVISVDEINSDLLLQEGEKPTVLFVSDINSAIETMHSKYFWIMGSCIYNGPANINLEKQIQKLCIKKKAPIAIYGYEYTDTRYGITGYGRFINFYSIPRYDYHVIFCVPMSEEEVLYFGRIGISSNDLLPSERNILHRNTGAKVTTVFENSPAYYANLSKNDVIFEINGKSINNSSELQTVLNASTSEDILEIKFSRNGTDRTVSLKPLF